MYFFLLFQLGLQEIEWVFSATSERWEHACEHLEPQIFLVAFMAELEAKKMDFYSHIQAIDSRTAAGRLSFAIFGAIAEFERSIIRERVCAGLARAKAEGKRLGRPTNVNVNTGVAVKLLREKGASIHAIAKQLKIGVSTTTRLLAA